MSQRLCEHQVRRSMTFDIIRVLVLISAGLSLSQAAAAQPASKTNVLLIVSDDQRPDTIRALGNETIRTPHLDRLVSEGTAFLRAVSPNPICTPARAEIMSGCSGFRNGVIDFSGKLEPNLPLLADTLRNAGYRTGYVGKWHNNGTPRDWGYRQTRGLFTSGGGRWSVPSFDWNGRPVTGYRGWLFRTDQGTPQPGRGVGLSANISEEFADAAIAMIGEDSAQPFFLHVNFTAPHDPLLMPFGYESRYDSSRIPLPENFRKEHPFNHGNLRGRDELLLPWPRTPELVRDELAVYYAAITHMDVQIGRILEALDEQGVADDTIVIFTSDHGLAIGSHGLRGKQNMYEHTIGVPLIVSGPKIPRGVRNRAQCYLRDLYPTLCELCGVETPNSVDGQSLVPILAGERDSIHSEIFGYFRHFQRMIRTDEWKLIHYPEADRWQLFHLPSDPLELTDLSNSPNHTEVISGLVDRLTRWQGRVNGPPHVRN